ncbi:phage major capsid protein [Streptomyces sp. SM12]|uniref:phage major capsid protein n=1 Tax=Streptomyces sp. SM12 TaxID=1071602 RepID=UPI000CD5C159|nr:phage major capsid protein [Streptomyces sp. SM12]
MAVDPTKAQLLGTNDSGTFAGHIPPELSEPIFREAVKNSVAMPLIPQVPLGPAGKAIPIFTGTPTAEWVEEAGAKPLVSGSVSMQHMKSHKIAAIFAVSAEVARANPVRFMEQMRTKLSESFGLAFDNAFFHGGGSGSSNSPFDQSLSQTTKTVELGSALPSEGGVYRDMVSVLASLTDDRKSLRSWALDSQIEPHLLTSLDANGRPFFVESAYTGTAPAIRTGSLLGRPVSMSDGLRRDSDVLGFAGDFRQAIWGVVGGINYDVSTQTTLPLGPNGEMISLWQHNLVAVRAEAEYGFLINDVEAFAKITVPADDEGNG